MLNKALLFAAVLSAACSHTPPTEAKRGIASPRAPAPIGAYSQAIQIGNTTYLAGQIPLDPASGQLIADGSIEAQTRQVLENLRAVLTASGMTLDDVVSTQVFVVDITEAPRMNAVYATYFQKLPPARVVVEVAQLPRSARIEIAATAVR